MSRHRSHRHHRSSQKKLVPYHVMLFILSLIALISIIILLEQVESAPVWKIVTLGLAAFTGLLFCVMLLKRSKK